MDPTQRETFIQNREWFNQFFQGLRQIFDRTASKLAIEHSLSSQSLYHPTLRPVPRIPPYYMVGIGGGEFAIQIYAILDVDMFRNQFFQAEPSIVVIRHADSDRYLYIGDYGERVLGDGPLTATRVEDSVLMGFIRGRTPFQAFQVGIEHFELGRDLDQEIDTLIVERLRNLPDLPVLDKHDDEA